MKIFNTLAFLLIFITTTHAQWEFQNIPISYCTLFSVKLVSPQICWAVGSVDGKGVILKTTDGGVNWVKQLTHPQPLHCVAFSDKDHGIIVGEKATILRTDDGGNTWKQQTAPTTSTLASVALPDSNTGYIISGHNLIKTTDGGNSWIAKTISPDKAFGLVFFIDKYNGIVLGETFAKTTDGGKTWDVSANPPVSDATTICMADKNTYFAGNLLGNLMMTTDGAKTWVNKTIAFCQNSCAIGGVSFATKNLGYCVAKYCRIFKTTDGGETWFLQPYKLAGGPHLYAVSYLDSLNCTAVGADAIVHTSTGGLTDIKAENNISNALSFYLEQNYPNPFNPSTNISFHISKTSFVKLQIFNLLGECVSTLVNEELNAGAHTIPFNASSLASGIYICKITTNGQSMTRKLLLMK